MIIYRCRPGVVLTEICQEYLLVASLSARLFCPYVKQVNETGAFLWKRLIEGASMEQLMKTLSDHYEIVDEKDAVEKTKQFIDIMVKNGYIISKEEKETENGEISRNERNLDYHTDPGSGI